MNRGIFSSSKRERKLAREQAIRAMAVQRKAERLVKLAAATSNARALRYVN